MTLTEQAAGTGEVVVFDFDGTLVQGDSFSNFVRAYCLRHPSRLLLMLLLLPVAAVVALRSVVSGISVLLWGMTCGTSTRSFALELRRYGRSVLSTRPQREVVGELARHVERGARVVVATASLPLLVRSFLASQRIAGPSVVGSRLERRLGGFVARIHCIGETKPKELARRLGLTRWTEVYTDSLVDLPIIQRSERVVFVTARPTGAGGLRSRVGAGRPLRVIAVERT